MQQQQQQQGGGSQFRATPPPEMTPFGTPAADPRTARMLQASGGGGSKPSDRSPNQLQITLDPTLTGVEEAASPISIRPPAVGHSGNFEEMFSAGTTTSTAGGGAHDEDALVGDEADRGGNFAGNRWPRQETLALLKVRSEMDAAFRDATLKGPLWEDVSKKLEEMGYRRSAKKCKEKFENVQKYYKRTKDGRAGRQDGKSYKFFTELEALHGSTASGGGSAGFSPASTIFINNPPSSINVAATVQVVIPSSLPTNTIPQYSSVISRVPPPPPSISLTPPQVQPGFVSPGTGSAPILYSGLEIHGLAVATSVPAGGISFSSDGTPSTSMGSEESEGEDEDIEEPSPKDELGDTSKRKRKRGENGSGRQRMMEFFEGLMNHVMKKQEEMQKKFLEAIEKREHDRMIREEAWKRQESTRLAHEQELLAQERAMSSSRDAAIINFLQKITGQNIQLPVPHSVSIPAAPPSPPPPPTSVSIPLPQSQPPPELQKTQQQQPQQQQKYSSSEVIVAAPEQQVPPAPQQEAYTMGGNFEPTSSRWPKAEVLALINLRSHLETRYGEIGSKGPLWEEISAGMLRLGYKRSSKRCKEKWENINKYFKKVKESNKKRPEDAKTCPYYHQLEALYSNKKLITAGSNGGGASSSLGFTNQSIPAEQKQQQENITVNSNKQETSIKSLQPVLPSSTQAVLHTTGFENKSGGNDDLQKSNSSQSDPEGTKKPADLMMVIGEPAESDNLEQHQKDEENYNDDEDDEEDDDLDEENEEKIKMAYKIQFQRQNPTGSSTSSKGGNGTPSFLALVR